MRIYTAALLTPAEAARLLGLSARTLAVWADLGKISSVEGWRVCQCCPQEPLFSPGAAP